MSQADSDHTTIAPFPLPSERPLPADPELAAAIITLGRHVEAVSVRMQAMFGASGAEFRPAAEQLVEELLTFLNFDEPDPDLEEDDSEVGGDEEASLGSTQMLNQERWSEGGACSELDCDRESDDSDKEPSLGSVAAYEFRSQEHWAAGQSDEREDDPAEMGIGDAGGLQEQTGGEPSLGSCDQVLDQRKWGRAEGWLAHDDGEVAAEVPIEKLDAKKAAYRERHPHSYSGLGGLIIRSTKLEPG